MKFIRSFFMVLGVLFFIQIVGIGYLVVADPFNVRPLMMMAWNVGQARVANSVGSEPTTAHTVGASGVATTDTPVSAPGENEAGTTTSAPSVSPAQAKALQSVGLDVNTIANITPAQEACFVSILGEARVNAVKAGAIPSASEFFSVRSCL